MKKIINWFKMEWEIFCLSDSVEGINMSKYELEQEIKKKYEK